jgi:hypothetical protein
MNEYSKSVPAVRAEVLVYYESSELGAEEVGRINFVNGEVAYSLKECLKEKMPFTREQLEKILSSLIESPIRVSKMRSKLLPGSFRELFPGSLAHLQSLVTQSGPFRLETV